MNKLSIILVFLLVWSSCSAPNEQYRYDNSEVSGVIEKTAEESMSKEVTDIDVELSNTKVVDGSQAKILKEKLTELIDLTSIINSEQYPEEIREVATDQLQTYFETEQVAHQWVSKLKANATHQVIIEQAMPIQINLITNVDSLRMNLEVNQGGKISSIQ